MSDYSSCSSDRVCPESTIESANRRNFIKKATLVAASTAVGSSIIGSKIFPESSATKFSPNCCGEKCFSTVTTKFSVNVDHADFCNGSGFSAISGGALIFGQCLGFCKTAAMIGSQRNNCTYSCCGVNCIPPGNNLAGLDFYTFGTKRMSITHSGNVGIGTGCDPIGSGVALCVRGGSVGISKPFLPSCSSSPALYVSANGTSGCKAFPVIGISGGSDCPTYGIGVAGCSRIGISGSSNTKCGVGVRGTANGPGSIPIVAKGCSSQTANLQQWQKGCTVKSVVNKCGWLGIAATKAATTLTVGGSVSAMVNPQSGSYSMGKTDFAVLAQGSNSTITLPAAKTGAGMMVYVKNVSSGTVSVAPPSGDKLEGGSASITLQKLGGTSGPSGMMFISDGSKNWYVLGSATP
jgi:hypothetical protein